MILSIIQLCPGIEELLSETQEFTSERIVNLIVRLVICNSETNLHIMSSLTAVVSRWAVVLIVSCCFHSNHDQFNSIVRKGFYTAVPKTLLMWEFKTILWQLQINITLIDRWY